MIYNNNNFSDGENSSSDSSNSSESKCLEILEKLQEKIKNFENPEVVEIDADINPNFRDNFYEKMKNMNPREILETFETCGNINIKDNDFGKIDEKKIKFQIQKMKKQEKVFLKEISKKNKKKI
jgi:hypothetical protein